MAPAFDFVAWARPIAEAAGLDPFRIPGRPDCFVLAASTTGGHEVRYREVVGVMESEGLTEWRTAPLPDGWAHTRDPQTGLDYVTRELLDIATRAKAGTEHEAHDGWDWLHPDRVLRCVCGTALVEPKP